MLMPLLLLACQAPPSAAPGGLPAVWGPEAAVDHDPADDVVEVHLTAGHGTVEWVEGETTEVWAYDGQVPGPLIQARVGDLVRVEFTNELDEPTTIHWHGMRIPDEMDGVPAVQDPVQPGETFVYEFVAPDPGSFWYHPHVRSHDQIERGLQGLLVVHEEAPPVVDRERYFTLDDVLLRAGTILPATNIPHMDAMHGRFGNTLLINGETDVQRDVVPAGSVERWRLVNTANARPMTVEITGATWRVMAVDGTLLEEPWEPPRLMLPVGRRFDVQVAPDGTGPVRLVSVVRTNAGRQEIPLFEGLVTGSRGPAALPDFDAPELPAPRAVEQEVVIELDAGSQDGSLAWTINGDVYGEGDAIPVQAHRPTRILVREHSGLDHPFHLHGQFFRHVEGGAAVPGQLDTILMRGGDEVELYSEFDNPGVWMAHCHILEHAELGMMTEVHVSE